MKLTAISMAVLLLLVIGLSLLKGVDTFKLGLSTAGSLLLRFFPVIVVAILLAGFAEALIPKEVVEAWLSDASGWRGIGIAWVAGILTPGGSIVGLPFVAALYSAGAGISVLITYLTSLALLSVMRIPLEVGFIGGRLTALRIAAVLVLPPIAGMIARFIAPLFLRNG
jgi:uncharacterized membrane protein YraQ (UPF0718 family)